MIDQLHAFASAAEAEAAFPRPLDDDGNAINAPCWHSGAALVMPVTVFVLSGDAVKPAPGTWIGVSCAPADADALWDLPSAKIEMRRPKGGPEFWSDRITRHRMSKKFEGGLRGVSPMFPPGYIFPDWPETPEEV